MKAEQYATLTEAGVTPLRIVDADLRAALKWVEQVHPRKTRDGGAAVEMTWEEWNALRRALGLREQPPRR